MLFNKNEIIATLYKVLFHIKDSYYAETYRVINQRGNKCFLKLFNYAKLPKSQFEEDGRIVEIEIAKQLNHGNLVDFIDSGSFIHDNQKYGYYVLDFISGETIEQKMAREQTCSVYEAKVIINGVLDGLSFLHNLEKPIIHNEICTQNVMLDHSQIPPVPIIIDFGRACYFENNNKVNTTDLNLYNVAPEFINGIQTIQTDIYAVGAMLYRLLYRMPPHFIDISKFSEDRGEVIDKIFEEKNKPLKIPDINIFELDEQLLNVIKKALATDVDERFRTAEDFKKALNGEISVSPPEKSNNNKSRNGKKSDQKKGNGLDDVAGMDTLKNLLRNEVIDVIDNPDAYLKLNVSIPNGMLLYGPPGCGKTFLAEKFAEEVDYHYIYKNCSDIASPYIHGGQTAIAELFAQARKNAPTILFLDEIDAMILSRNMHHTASESGEVNVFLAELNNCGKDGVFVIGACNDPRRIDKAALRSGRLEKHFYVSNPDRETRIALLKLYLREIGDLGIDYDFLADNTDYYSNVDIVRLIQEAARKTGRKRQSKVTMDMLKHIITEIRPNLTRKQIAEYQSIRDEFKGDNTIPSKKNKIGFKNI